MLIDKLKYLQGYVKVKLYGYAPERFFNLCGNHNILIWNLAYEDEHYVFCISVQGLKSLKPILKKTRTKFVILERYGLPFLAHRYRKRKVFAAGILLCGMLLYTMSLYVWKIEVNGNLHRTDSTVLKFLDENHVYHGQLKSKIDCEKIEEVLRAGFDDVIWASAKLEGTMLVIDIQENLATNQQAAAQAVEEGKPRDIVADKDAVIERIFTRKGVPKVEKGMEVHAGDLLVEGKIPVMGDDGEVASCQYCTSDADIYGITRYEYAERFPVKYQGKVFTGRQKKRYGVRLLEHAWKLPEFSPHFKESESMTDETDLKIGDSFYLPIVFTCEIQKEYKTVEKTYTKEEAKQLAKQKLDEFCKNLTQKGVQIIENNVIIETDADYCSASGSLKVIERIGTGQDTVIAEEPQEGQIADESDGENN